MTTTARETRVALLRARFVDVADLDLGSTGYMLSGLDDLLAFEWLFESPEAERSFGEAPSAVGHAVSLNSPLEVMLWVSGGLGVAHSVVRLFDRIQGARTRKARADAAVQVARDIRRHLQHSTSRRTMDIENARASESLALLDALEIIDVDEIS